MKRLPALVATVCLIGTTSAGSVSVAASPPARQTYDIGMCTTEGPRPCVVSALRNGEPLTEGYRVVGTFFAPDQYSGNANALVHAYYDQDFDLGFDSHSDTWTITVDMGTIAPRTVHGRSTDTTVIRRPGQGANGGNLVTVTGHPVTVSGQCDASNNCPEWSEAPTARNRQWDGTFGFSVTDFGSMPEDEQPGYYGLNYFSNIAVGVVPPAMREDEQTGEKYMYIELANRHYLRDGVTVFKGSVDISIPDRFLRERFGIPNPETMTDTSLTTTVGGAFGGRGQVAVRRSADDDAMEIEIRNMTFSERTTRIELGTVRPTAPRSLRARALQGGRASMVFKPSKARGAKVSGYTGRCSSVSGTSTLSATRVGTRITLRGMLQGRRYECRVRANSRLGASRWSKPVRVFATMM